jgi:hypothetical protein
MRDVMGLVVDPGVVAEALLGGAARAVVVAGLRRRFVWGCSVPLFWEYRAALACPDLLLDAGVTRREAAGWLADLAAVVVPVELRFLWRPLLREVGAEVVVQTAVNAGAGAVVTRDLRAFAGVAERFGLRVWTPAETRGMLGL